MKQKGLLRNSAASLILLSLVNGCASMPTDGSVNHFANKSATGQASESSQAVGPVADASPEEIIQGFLRAGSGSSDNYAVARQYLTEDMADSWQPDEQTIVYAETPQVSLQKSGDYQVDVVASSKINDVGLATSFPAGSPEELKFSLEQVDGQWRISSAPNGLVLNQQEFNDTFGAFTLYFYDPSFTYLVPDVRWLAQRSATVTSLVRLTLQGSAPYLQDAVVGASSQAISLSRNSVPVEDGTAKVDLTGSNINSIEQADLARLMDQLGQTLRGVAGIESIEITLDGKPVEISTDDSQNVPITNPQLPANIVGLAEDSIVLRTGPDPSASSVTVPTQGALAAPAVNYANDAVAVLDSTGNRLALSDLNTLAWVYEGQGLTRPSFDQYGWAWVGDANGGVHAVRNNTEHTEADVEASWLEGVGVTSFNISRDGTRAVISGERDGQSYVWVAGIIRGENDYEPTRLNNPVRVTSGTSQVADWLSENSVLVGERETGHLSAISLTGSSESLGKVEGLSTLNVGLGEEEIIATDNNGATYLWSGADWGVTDLELEDVNYSG